MEDEVGAVHQLRDERAVPDVALDEADRVVGQRVRQVPTAAADEIVEDDDLVRPRGYQLVNDRRADRACPSRDQAPAALDHAAPWLLTAILAPLRSALSDAASSSSRTLTPKAALVSDGRSSAIAPANSAITFLSASRWEIAGACMSPSR